MSDTKKASCLPASLAPAVLRPNAAAEFLGISTGTLANMENDGRIGPKTMYLGAAKCYGVAELTAWVAHGMPCRTKWFQLWPQRYEEHRQEI